MNNLPPTSEIFTYQDANILGVLPSTIEAVLESYPYPPRDGVPYTYFAHYALDKKYLNPVFLEIMTAGGMEVFHSEAFFRPGTGELYDAFIHTDGHEVVPCMTKFNWVVGDEGNLMNWYVPHREVTDSNRLTTRAGTKYLVFEEEEVELIDQLDMQGLYVVNAGIPHGVKMTSGSSTNPRTCVSIVPRLPGHPMSMGAKDAYLRLLYGAKELQLLDKEIFNQEYQRLIK